jgi:hypothetical protein
MMETLTPTSLDCYVRAIDRYPAHGRGILFLVEPNIHQFQHSNTFGDECSIIAYLPSAFPVRHGMIYSKTDIPYMDHIERFIRIIQSV